MKTNQIAEVGLTYKTNTQSPDMPVINSPDKAQEYLREIWDENTLELKEEFVVLLLNNAKQALGWSKISSGGTNATIVDPALIFQLALLANANAVILAHNHPGGCLKASAADISLTRNLIEGAELLGITVVDHIILTRDGYLSMKSRGLV